MRNVIMKIIRLGITAILGIILGVAVFEIALQVILPEPQAVNRVFFFEPDPDLGWRARADFDFQWRGNNPYCVEFDVPVEMNNFGFHDDDWDIDKPDNTIRIALLGDSLVEAIQVQHEDTADEVLEALLNTQYPEQEFEVMNFGISNYGVGQMQLVYEHVAQEFNPDYIFINVAYFHMNRTPQRQLQGFTNEDITLTVRPTYELDDAGELVFLPQTDYDAYVEAVAEIEAEFGSDRTFVIEPENRLYVSYINEDFPVSLSAFINNHPPIFEAAPDAEFEDIPLNYAIIGRLAEQVESNNSQLIFVDIFDYFAYNSNPSGSGTLSSQNQDLAEDLGIGYIHLSPDLRNLEQSAIFPCDHHLTVDGNRIFANAMFQWLQPIFEP